MSILHTPLAAYYQSSDVRPIKLHDFFSKYRDEIETVLLPGLSIRKQYEQGNNNIQVQFHPILETVLLEAKRSHEKEGNNMQTEVKMWKVLKGNKLVLTGITDRVVGFLEKQLEEKVEFFVPLQANVEENHFIVYLDVDNLNDLGEKELKKLKTLGLVTDDETGTSHELLQFLGCDIFIRAIPPLLNFCSYIR